MAPMVGDLGARRLGDPHEAIAGAAIPVSFRAIVYSITLLFLVGCGRRDSGSIGGSSPPEIVVATTPNSRNPFKCGQEITVNGRIIPHEGSWAPGVVLIKILKQNDVSFSYTSYGINLQPTGVDLPRPFEAKLKAPANPGHYLLRAIAIGHPGEDRRTPISARAISTKKITFQDMMIKVRP